MKGTIDFAIVGVQKSGTTFINNALGMSPEVHTYPGEFSMFLMEKKPLDEIKDVIRSWNVPDGALVGFKRANHLTNEIARNKLFNMNKKCKIIAILRNPASRAIAGYYHLMLNSILPLKDPVEGFEKILHGDWTRKFERAKTVIDYSFYAQGIRDYQKLFGKDSVACYLFDDLKQDSQGLVDKIAEFLGIARFDISGIKDHRPQKVVYSIERQRFLRCQNVAKKILDDNGFRIGLPENIKPYEQAFIQTIQMFDQNIMSKIAKNDDKSIQVVREMLHPVFQQDIEKTEALIGRSLEKWKKGPDSSQ